MLDVIFEGSRFDPICPVVVDWRKGLVPARETDCRLGELPDGVVHRVPSRGNITLHSEPRENAPSRHVDVEPGTVVTPLRVHGRTDVELVGARRFGDEWLEVEVGGMRGWVHDEDDLELLGFGWIDRC